MSVEIEVGSRWEDRDRFYDTLPDGTYPIPETYEGPLGLRRRVVEIVQDNGAYLHVRNAHNGRRTRVRRSAFTKPGPRQGFTRL